MKDKTIIKIISLVLLANLTLANFAFAQTPVPPPTPAAGRGNTPTTTNDALDGSLIVIISPGEYQKMNDQGDTNKCNIELSNRLYKIPFNWGLFQTGLTDFIVKDNATWLVARWDYVNKECVIYEKNRISAFAGITGGKTAADYAREGKIIEEEGSLARINVRGDYFLDRSPFAIEVQTVLMNASTDITVKAIKDRFENYNKDDGQASTVSKLIGYALNAVLSALNAFILWVTALVGGIFTTALSWVLNNTMPDIVTTGWTIVRDLCNMFFILIMIVIALAAILRIEAYDYKHLLGEVIIMAILVNFSKVIATTLVDFVSYLASVFAIHNASEIWAFLYRYVNFGDLNSLPNGWMAGLVQGLSKLLFSFIALATFLALTGLLIIRIVAIYILIILSPLAYVLDILPTTKHFAHEWWGYFLKNLLWLPASLLIVKLTILLSHSKEFTASDSAFNVIILMAFLWGAVIVAEHVGAAGSHLVVGAAEQLWEKPMHAAGHTVLGFTGQRWNEFTTHMYEAAEAREREKAKAEGRPYKGLGLGKRAIFAAAQPINTVRSWMEYSHEERQTASEHAKATAMEVVEKARSGIDLPYREFLAMKEEREKAKLFVGMAKEKKAQIAEQLDQRDDHEGAILRRGLMIAAINDNHIEDFVNNPYFGERFMDEKGSISSGSATYNFIHSFLRAEGPHADAESQRFIASDMNELAVKAGRFDYSGYGLLDPRTGEYMPGMVEAGTAVNPEGHTVRVMKDNGRILHAMGELKKKGGRARAELSSFNTADLVVNRDSATGKPLKDALGNYQVHWVGLYDDFKTEATKLMNEATLREVQHTAERTVQSWIPGETDGYNITVDYPDQLEAVKKFWTENQSHFKAILAKKLDVQEPAKQSTNISKVTVMYKDPATGVVTREVLDDGRTGHHIYDKVGGKIDYIP